MGINITGDPSALSHHLSFFFFLKAHYCARMNWAVLIGLLLSIIVVQASPWFRLAAQGKNIQAAAEREEADVAFKAATEDVHKEEIKEEAEMVDEDVEEQAESEKVYNTKRNKGVIGCGKRCANYNYCKKVCRRGGKGATCEDGCKREKFGCGCPW